MIVQPYICFEGRCEEAIEFYKRAVGAKVEMLLRMNQNPEPQPGCQPPAGCENKIMHSQLRIGDTVIMASDGRCQGKAAFQGMCLSLTVADDAEAKRVFGALGEGGQVDMPLARTFFSSSFGTLKDRFGVTWMVLAQPKEQPRRN